MLIQHKSDPNCVTVTPRTRRRRKLKKQQTTISRQSSSNESFPQGYSLYQLFMSTKSAVQGIGYNFRHFLFDESRAVLEDESSDRAWILGESVRSATEFYEKWFSLSRMTYRRHWQDSILNPVSSLIYDTDTGWGCTIRSCQMLIAQVITRSGYNPKRIPALFSDRETALLSIHRFIHCDSDRHVGEWFGPTSVMLVLQKLLSISLNSHLGLGFVLSLDGRLYTPEISEQSKHAGGSSLASSSVTSPPVTRTDRVNSWPPSLLRAFLHHLGRLRVANSSTLARQPMILQRKNSG
jgi:hypothetical protein